MIFKQINFKSEEVWNTITHGLGAVLSVTALILMLVYSIVRGSYLEIISSLIFGMALIFLYTASTLYHAASTEKMKTKLRRYDHLCIYLLIAGTYTPVMLVGLKGIWGWVMFVSVWALAVIGFIFKFSKFKYNEKISLSLYAIMGWLAVVAIKPLLENLSFNALIYLGLGGLAYTVGIYFYANHKIKFNHLIWHLFVMAGSAFHFTGIFGYILP